MRHLDATRSAAAAQARQQERTIRVAGVGLLTPLGLSAASTWDALLRGEHIRSHSRIPCDVAAGEDRSTALALRAAREAIDCARWAVDGNDQGRTAILVGTSKGPVESWLAPPLHMLASPYMVGGVSLDGIARVAAAVGQAFHLTGPRLTLSAACASGLHALIRAALMLRSGDADRALVVATESSLHPLFEASFKRLGVLAHSDRGCRPFDQFRDGFLISESAAAVCLEAAGAPGNRENHDQTTVCIDRFALGADATHLTSGDPAGSTLRRLLHAILDDRPVDLVHAHGTATLANDQIELAAIESSLPPGSSAAIYSHKGALGHSLGAAGLVSVVLNCACHRSGIVPPNVRTTNPLATRATLLSSKPIHRPIRRSIALAAGFGGPIAAVGLYAR